MVNIPQKPDPADDIELRPATREVLDTIPEGIARIAVVDGETGKNRWKRVDSVEPKDMVVFRKGAAVTMANHPGKPLGYKHHLGSVENPGGSKDTIVQAVSGNKASSRRKKFYAQDRLLQAALTNPDSESILAITIKEFALESSSLSYERMRAESEGRSKDASQFSLRRLKALQALAQTWIKRNEINANKAIDLQGVPFLRLFEFIVRTFQEAMIASDVPEDQAEVIINDFSKRVEEEEWIGGAKDAMKGKS